MWSCPHPPNPRERWPPRRERRVGALSRRVTRAGGVIGAWVGDGRAGEDGVTAQVAMRAGVAAGVETACWQ